MARLTYVEQRSGSRYSFINEDYSSELADGGFERLQEQALPADGLSRGRGGIQRITTESGKKLLVRRFLRGGLPRHFVHDSFFRLPGTSIEQTRPIAEFRILCSLVAAGVSVPTPVLAQVSLNAVGLLYSGLIVTEEIPNVVNLLDHVSRPEAGELDLDYCRALGRMTGLKAAKALDLGIYHPDLHLGNVLLAPDDEVYLIDFDKAYRFSQSDREPIYKEKLIRRWKRSLLRQSHLPDNVAAELSQSYIEGLSL